MFDEVASGIQHAETAARPPEPAATPDDLSLLSGLVDHREAVDIGTALAEVHRMFQASGKDFFAITENRTVVGLCSRASVGFLLGSRYGFALYGQSTVWAARVPRPLIYSPATPLRQLLDEVFSRTGSEFFEDIILIAPDRSLLGLLPVPELARLQLQLFADQLHKAVVQDEELRHQNLELFQVNQQLRQSQGRYKSLFENNALGVALLDRHGTIVAHNRRFAQLLRLTDNPDAEELVFARNLQPHDQPQFARLLAGHEARAPDSEPCVTELRFAFGEMVRSFTLHSSWVAETGQICVCLSDVTDQRALEQRAARQDKQSMLDTLVAGVAHELNNKLTPVLGFASLLQDIAPESLRQQTHYIAQSTEEAAKIIRQLLTLSRPEQSVHHQFDLREVCEDARQMLSFQLREANCVVELTVPAVPVGVAGDAAKLKQVLINLILNSLHAMEGVPEPRLGIRLKREGTLAKLQIRDNGTGIKPELLERIFDPFFTTKGPKGTGLGLSISASIIRQHGGDIAVESTPGAGATFTLRLPAAPLPTPAHGPATDATAPKQAEEAERIKILVVDDEEFVRQFLQEALRICLKCTVDTATDGLEAISLLEANRYHLVVSDIRMPRLDGLQLRTWLLENQPALARRLVLVTGHAGSIETDSTLGKLDCPVVRKPFTIDVLRDTCNRVLRSD